MSIFMFLEGEIKSKGEKGIAKLVHFAYRDKLLSQSKLYENLIQSILLLINEERVNEIDHKLQLKKMILMLEKLDVYHHKFQKAFVEETDRYYKELAGHVFENSNIYDYLYCIEKSLRKEQERIESYLSVSSTRESIDKVELRMIREMADQIVEKGMKLLVDSNKLQELKLLYKLFKQVNLLATCETSFVKVVKETGERLVMVQTDEKELINVLLAYRENIENIMQVCFENNIKFKYSNKMA